MKNWYIGQRIVAVKNHSQGEFKAGDEFIINGLQQNMCKCTNVVIHIGKSNPYGTHCYCPDCRTLFVTGEIWWFHEEMFSPLDEIESAISELMESVNVVKV